MLLCVVPCLLLCSVLRPLVVLSMWEREAVESAWLWSARCRLHCWRYACQVDRQHACLWPSPLLLLLLVYSYNDYNYKCFTCCCMRAGVDGCSVSVGCAHDLHLSPAFCGDSSTQVAQRHSTCKWYRRGWGGASSSYSLPAGVQRLPTADLHTYDLTIAARTTDPVLSALLCMPHAAVQASWQSRQQ